MTLEQFVQLAFEEDVKDGDHTSQACIPENAKGRAKLLVKDEGIIAGISIAEKLFALVDPDINFEQHLNDGDKVKFGDIAFHISGSSRSILTGERLVLNVMQRMSGVATKTNQVAQRLQGLKTKVLDTRKTTPLLRFLEKEAVRIGGGTNHRFGLYDMMMIKDNHIDYAGGIKQAIDAANSYQRENSLSLKIEIEARNLNEVKEILSIGKVDRIMLDNFSYDDLRQAVELIGDKFETEASGGITFNTAREFAECGVDYISMGAITHTIKNFDLSLKAVNM